MTNDSNLRELETWYQRAGKLRDPGYWETLRTGDKSRGTQTKACLADYASHPLHQQTIHQFGSSCSPRSNKAEIDAENTPRTTGGWASKKTNPLVRSGCPQVRMKRATHRRQPEKSFPEFGEDPLVELRGFEPLTPSMPWRCATSCATAPYDYSRAAPVGGDRVSLSGTPRDSPNRSAHTGLVPTFHATIRQVLSYSRSSAQ
jgi:hypothetical protein